MGFHIKSKVKGAYNTEKSSLNFQDTCGKVLSGKSSEWAAREKERYLEDVAIKMHVKPLTVLNQKDEA